MGTYLVSRNAGKCSLQLGGHVSKKKWGRGERLEGGKSGLAHLLKESGVEEILGNT